MTEYPDGPELVKQADVPVADRRLTVVDKYHSWNPEHALTKAYELMSCYQGLVEYYQVTGRKEYLDAAVKTAKSIATTEINLAGGGAAGEHWFHGADQQWRHISWPQETCVITTWMRLCEKLRAVTGDPYWSEQLEKTFYNAYLGALNFEADTFAAYTPLMGSRARSTSRTTPRPATCGVPTTATACGCPPSSAAAPTKGVRAAAARHYLGGGFAAQLFLSLFTRMK